ncbi:MAG: heparan-alpha-glucosaminide N-acetyltransferase domain-containing protein [Candidatus Kryptoniota bacterium]
MTKSRIGYIDQFRGLATIFMVETHVINALLLTALRGQFTFKIVDFVNGFVAPSFLFVAGFSFTLALNRKGDAYRRFSGELWLHIRRLVYIWATGYLMHVPYFSLYKSVHHSTPQDILSFLGVDILQCIATTLIILHIVRILVKKDKIFNYFLYGLFLLFVLWAPAAGAYDFTKSFPTFFAQYFNRMHGSLFPLFPWSSFLIAGTIVSQKITFDKENRFSKYILLVGTLLVFGGLALMFIHTKLFPRISAADYSIGWFIVRLGFLLWILKSIIWYESKRARQYSVVKIFGHESFLVYVTHVLFIYGSSAKHVALVQSIGQRLNYLQCFGIFVVLTSAMFVLAFFWSMLKSRRYKLSRLVQYTFVSWFLYLFIKNPY